MLLAGRPLKGRFAAQSRVTQEGLAGLGLAGVESKLEERA
jgi:hypothetical protein